MMSNKASADSHSLNNYQLTQSQQHDNKDETKDNVIVQYSISKKQIQIFINATTGKRFMLDAKPNETIQDIKAKIQNRYGFQSECQRLSIYLTGKDLHDNCTLSDYGIHNGSHLTLNIQGKSTGKLTLDLRDLIPSMIDTSKWQFEYRAEERYLYAAVFFGTMDIETLLQSINLSHSSNELCVALKPESDEEVIIKNPNHEIPRYGESRITIKLDHDKTKISTDIECIKHLHSKLEAYIEEPILRVFTTNSIEALKKNELYTKIPACKSLQQLSSYKRFDEWIFDKINIDIHIRATEYAKRSIRINDIIVAAKKKIQKIEAEQQKDFTASINEFEGKLFDCYF